MKHLIQKVAFLGAVAAGLAAVSVSASAMTQPAYPLTLKQFRLQTAKILHKAGVQVTQVGETLTLSFPSAKLFKYDSANLRPHYLPALKLAANLIRTYRTTEIKVAAYTDNYIRAYGPKYRKLALTSRQAQAVANYLYHDRVGTQLIYSQGFGHSHPIASNASAKGRAANRRVVVSFRFYRDHS